MTGPSRRTRWIRAAAGLAAVIVVLGIGGLFALQVAAGPLWPDSVWQRWIAQLRTPWLDGIARALDFVGAGWVGRLIVPLVMAAGFLLARRPWSAVTFVIAAPATAWAVDLLKPLFGRERPDGGLIDVASAAFPSGHAANAAVASVLLVLLLKRSWVWMPALGWVILMALSRTYLGVHWASDVVAGAIFGAGTALLAWASFAGLLERERYASRALP